MPIRWPLLEVGAEAHMPLIERCKEHVREAATRLSCWPVEVDDTIAPGWLHVDAWLTCEVANLEAVRRALASDLEVGDEVAIDLWNPGEEGATLLGLELATWQSFQRDVLAVLRASFGDDHHLSDEVHAAWLNLDYAAGINARAPDLNPSSPGRPYFDGEGALRAGQWLRVVVELRSRGTFWCVGTVADGEEYEVRFRDLAYEGGADGVAEAARGRVEAFRVGEGVARRAEDGLWDVVLLTPA